jgi:hypothetical protein
MKPKEREFLSVIKQWDGAVEKGVVSPWICSAADRQSCKRKGWVTFDGYYWRLTAAGRAAVVQST